MDSRIPAPPLHRADLDPDPIREFGRWLEAARERIAMPEATCLATVDDIGAPDGRMVLLKGAGAGGFRFYTNELSVKAAQLAAHPLAALVFHWPEVDRQVRIRGEVERVSDEDADAYFASRPRDSQLGAWASPQSKPLADRAELEGRLSDAENAFAGREIPRPGHWGGYIVRPVSIEFWQGRPGRLHDRFRYDRVGQTWKLTRIAP